MFIKIGFYIDVTHNILFLKLFNDDNGVIVIVSTFTCLKLLDICSVTCIEVTS